MKKGPKFFSESRADTPHVGEMLVAYYKKKKIRQAPLARDMNRSEKTMITYKKNKSIQTAILWELCHVLHHNFFADLAGELPKTFSQNSDGKPDEKDEQIAVLKAENAELRKETEVLHRIIRERK